jgi:hypothetical protein
LGIWRTFSIITEAHLGLSESDGILAFADPIELFKLRLVDALFIISLPFLLLPRFKAVAWGPKWAFQLT